MQATDTFPWPLFGFSDLGDTANQELTWVHQAQAGDPDAFTWLVNHYQKRVFQLCSRFFRRPEDVEEAAQETFLMAWRKLDRYTERAPFEHWLTRVCLNTSLGILRRQKKRSAETELLSVEFPAAPQNADARLEASRLIARLPSADAMVLRLLHTEGWTVAELADRLGWTEANVKVRAYRARLKLRRWVERDMIECERARTNDDI